MLRPNYEDPLDTAQQIVDNNITIFMYPGTEIWKQFLETSTNPTYRKIGETLYVTKDWDEYTNITESFLFGERTHAQIHSYMNAYSYESGRLYKSKESIGGKTSSGGYLCNKKWYLNEVKNNSISNQGLLLQCQSPSITRQKY